MPWSHHQKHVIVIRVLWLNRLVHRNRAGDIFLVHNPLDPEDIYGAIAVYKAIEPKDSNNDHVFLVMGPWHHGQEIADGSSLGAIKWGSDTALYFRQKILRPFLDHYLKDDAPKMDVAPVTAFETGTNEWRRYDSWPSGSPNGPKGTPLYLSFRTLR